MKAGLLITWMLPWIWQQLMRWEVPAVLVRFHPETAYAYVLGPDGYGKVLDPKGQIIAQNQWIWQGVIKDIDMLKGGNVLITFEGYTASIVTGPFLGMLQTIEWAEMTIWDVQSVCASQYGWLWIYDAVDGRLKRLDEHLQVEFESAPLTTYQIDIAPPIFMREHQGRLYTAVPGAGVWVWDIYGNYLYRIAVDVEEEFWVVDSKLYFLQDGRIYEVNLSGGLPQPVELHGLNTTTWPVRSITVHDHHIWTATDREVVVWERK